MVVCSAGGYISTSVSMQRRKIGVAIRRLVGGDGPILVRALVCCVLVRIAVWVVPSRTLLRHVRKRVDAVESSKVGSTLSIDRIAWSVRAAGRRVPRATCLVQALAVQLLLARSGHHSELRIGVIRDDAGAFAAHAWVVAGGKVIVGARRGMRYHVLPDLAHTLR
jgi:hypothetical protein